MIQGAISQDYKSLLVFLEKEEGARGVNLRAYYNQVLQPVIFPLFKELRTEYIFIEDSSKVYKGKARLAKLEYYIRGFDQLPSSPDLNVIKKVQRQIKEGLKKLLFVPTSREALIREI